MFRILIILSLIALTGCSEPQIEYVYYPQYIEKQIPTLQVDWQDREVIIGVDDLREFESPDALSRWLSQHHVQRQDDLICVDYALEVQRRALSAGYLVSIQLIDTNLDKDIDHAICSTWIGDDCWFFEDTRVWLGAIRDDKR